jgi:hypothetical protein
MMEDIILPIFMCVVMPVMIVWLVMWTKRHETDKMAEIMLKSMETGNPIDPVFFQRQVRPRKSIKSRLVGLLTAACILMSLGIGFILVGFIIILGCHWTLQSAPSGFTIIPFAGGILLVVGIALLLVYFIQKKILAKEIEAEERALEAPKE